MRPIGIGSVRSPGIGRVALACAWLALSASAWPAPAPRVAPRARLVAAESAPTVESVAVRGNRFVPAATLLYYVSTKAGDRYDETRLRADFRRLWATGFLDDVSLDVSDGTAGKIVTFVVRERPRITKVEFRGSKALSHTAIEDKLKAKNASLKLDTFYDPRRVIEVESILREMLADAGRPLGTVHRQEKAAGDGGVQLTFVIDDGEKMRVGEIVFTGNRAFSSAALRRSMKAIHQVGFLSWLHGGTTYSEDKWAEDQERIEEFYRNRGYVLATVGAPQVSHVDGKCGLPGLPPCRHLRLTIPVTEGDRYRLGTLDITGLTVFPQDKVRALIKLRPGQTYNWSRIKKAYETLRDWYGAKGYFNWTPQTKTDTHAETHVVDVTLDMQEDRQYFVGFMSFVGNDTTRDHVARREISLNEGDVLDTEALKASIRRLNQLGYFKPIATFPELRPSSVGENALDLTFKVEEQNRAQFNVGGGVSGDEGTFVNSTLSTTNFLGLGDSLQLTAQGGKRVRNYEIAMTDPYFLDRPLTAGIDLYHRRIIPYLATATTTGYADGRTGFTLTSGRAISRFTRFFASYTYEFAKVENVDVNGNPVTAPTTTGSTDQILRDEYGDPGQWHDSRVTLSLVHDTVDNRWLPRSGLRLQTNLQLSGGPLGGTLNAFHPNAEVALYVPFPGRTALALHADGGWVWPFGKTAELQPLKPGEIVQHDGLPFVDRFAVGGENQVRGYPFFAIFPALTPDGRVIRGDGYAVVNGELYWDTLNPVRVVGFFDAGTTFRKGERPVLDQFKISTGIEMRVTLPVLNLPLRFIYAWNPNRSPVQIAAPWNVKASTFKFAVGTAF